MMRRLRLCAVLPSALLLAACAGGDGGGGASDPARPATAAPSAAAPATTPRVETGRPDARGVVSYGDYEAIQARRGDTVQAMAARVGLSASELAAYNGLPTSYVPRPGDELVLPPRPGGYADARAAAAAPVAPAAGEAQPLSAPAGSGAGAAAGSGGEWSPALIDQALERADEGEGATVAGAGATGGDATRIVYHEVKKGETAESIAADYGIALDTLVSWNALSGPAYSVAPGQILTIPARGGAGGAVGRGETISPSARALDGEAPPSALRPLPADTASPPVLQSPQLGQYQTAVPKIEPVAPLPEAESASIEQAPAAEAEAPAAQAPAAAQEAPTKFVRPVPGRIVRGYDRARGPNQNEGVDFAASPGEAVKAAADGTVALVSTSLGEWGDIVLVRHPGNLMTVYGRLGEVAVRKGDKVSAGQTIGTVAAPQRGRALMHFEVRRGAFSENPADYF